jgi:hypothetical protein
MSTALNPDVSIRAEELAAIGAIVKEKVEAVLGVVSDTNPSPGLVIEGIMTGVAQDYLRDRPDYFKGFGVSRSGSPPFVGRIVENPERAW